jgi:hypothetical protein
VLVLDVRGHRPLAVVRLLQRRARDRLDAELVHLGDPFVDRVGAHVALSPPLLAHHEEDLFVVDEDLADAALVERVAPGVDRWDVVHVRPRF